MKSEKKIRTWLESIGARKDDDYDPWTGNEMHQFESLLSPLTEGEVDELCGILTVISTKRTSTGVLYSDIINSCPFKSPLHRSSKDRLNIAALMFATKRADDILEELKN